MDFLESAKLLIPALSGIPVTIDDGSGSSLTKFEEQYCFLPEIQPWMTKKGILEFFKTQPGEYIYELTDLLEIRLIIFKIESRWVLLGPFVNRTWNDWEMHNLLAETGLKSVYLIPYQLYRCSLSVNFISDVLHITTVVIENTTGNIPPKEIKSLSKQKEHYQLDCLEVFENIDLINCRYALENKFMEAVSEGKTKAAIDLFHELGTRSVGLKFYSPDIRDSIAGAAIIRTLVRKASEKAGLTPIVIDSVSQQYAQQIHLAVRTESLQPLMEKYISQICYMIRKEREREYSLYVKKTVQYIDIRISENLTIANLASVVGLTPAYLAKIFRRETGMTVNQYIAKTRCMRAAELLEKSDLSVQEISAFVGYLDNNWLRCQNLTPSHHKSHPI